MKKILSILLTAVMVLSLVPLSTFSVSAEETDSQGVVYTLSDDGTYYIVSSYTREATEVIIHAEYNGLPVKEIGDYAFYECYGLTSIEIPDSVTSISSIGFSGCDSLESITVTDGNAVYKSSGNCIIETSTKTLIAGCKNSVIPVDGSVTSIGDYAFSERYALESISIPNTVTRIGRVAFGRCWNLKNIDIPNSVTSIGFGAFAESGLTSITIPDSVTGIGTEAFYWCNLTSIEIPDSVIKMGFAVFLGCEALTDIYCEAESQPEGWATEWLSNQYATVHWGCEMTNSSKPTLGNIDSDGDIDASDYILLKRAVLKTYNLTEEQKSVADIDKDNDVDAADYVLVKRIVLGTYIVK